MNKIFARIMSYFFIFILGCYVGSDLVGVREIELYSWIGTILFAIYFLIGGNKK